MQKIYLNEALRYTYMLDLQAYVISENDNDEW